MGAQRARASPIFNLIAWRPYRSILLVKIYCSMESLSFLALVNGLEYRAMVENTSDVKQLSHEIMIRNGIRSLRRGIASCGPRNPTELCRKLDGKVFSNIHVVSGTHRERQNFCFSLRWRRFCHFPVWCVCYLKLEQIAAAVAIARLRISHRKCRVQNFDKVVKSIFPIWFLISWSEHFVASFLKHKATAHKQFAHFAYWIVRHCITYDRRAKKNRRS